MYYHKQNTVGSTIISKTPTINMLVSMISNALATLGFKNVANSVLVFNESLV